MSCGNGQHMQTMNNIHKMSWEKHDYWLDYNSSIGKKVFKNWKDDYVPGKTLSNSDAFLYYKKLNERIRQEKNTFHKKKSGGI